MWSCVQWNTHMHTCVRSVANTRCSTMDCGSWSPETWWAQPECTLVILLAWEQHICLTWVIRGGWRNQLTAVWASCVGAVSLVFLRSISCSSYGGTSGGLAHQRRGWRDQEQVLRGQSGVLHWPSSPSTNSFALIICLEWTTYPNFQSSHRDFCLNRISWVWDFFVVKKFFCFFFAVQVNRCLMGGGGVEGGAHKPQSTLSCHQCLDAAHGFETGSWSTNLNFCIYEDRSAAHESCVDDSSRRRDGITTLRDLSSLWHSQQMEKKKKKKLQVILLIKRPFKNPTPVWRLRLRLQHFRLQPEVSLMSTQTWKIWYWNQMVIRHEGSLDKQVWSSSSITIA